jgi:hypothetical protein
MTDLVLCPHCGRAPADADGFACDYCRGFAHRPPHVARDLYTCTECRQTTIPPRLVESTDRGGIYTVPALCRGPSAMTPSSGA